MVKDLTHDAHIAGPVLTVDDEDAARTDCDVIDVGPLPSWPAHIVEGFPAVSLQGVEGQRGSRLTVGTALVHVGNTRVALGFLTLPSRKLAR